MLKNVIAIDGPAGSGKSTVSRIVADRLGFLYIDTGAMYRALTLKAVSSGIGMDDKEALSKLSANLDVGLKREKGALKVYLDKKDVSEAIRSPEITNDVKFVARIKEVRRNMVKLQRQMAERAASGAVLEGRDIGTVVFPDAKFKFYLDASHKERVRRRHKELREKGVSVSLEATSKDVEARDESDLRREYAPLKKSDDAVYIDTTALGIEEVVSRILEGIKEKK